MTTPEPGLKQIVVDQFTIARCVPPYILTGILYIPPSLREKVD